MGLANYLYSPGDFVLSIARIDHVEVGALIGYLPVGGAIILADAFPFIGDVIISSCFID